MEKISVHKKVGNGVGSLLGITVTVEWGISVGPRSWDGVGFNSAELGQDKQHLKDNAPEMFLKPEPVHLAAVAPVLLIEMWKSEKPRRLILLPEEN